MSFGFRPMVFPSSTPLLGLGSRVFETACAAELCPSRRDLRCDKGSGRHPPTTASRAWVQKPYTDWRVFKFARGCAVLGLRASARIIALTIFQRSITSDLGSAVPSPSTAAPRPSAIYHFRVEMRSSRISASSEEQRKNASAGCGRRVARATTLESPHLTADGDRPAAFEALARI